MTEREIPSSNNLMQSINDYRKHLIHECDKYSDEAKSREESVLNILRGIRDTMSMVRECEYILNKATDAIIEECDGPVLDVVSTGFGKSSEISKIIKSAHDKMDLIARQLPPVGISPNERFSDLKNMLRGKL